MTMTTDFTIEFSGESKEVDLNVLLTSLLNFGAAIQEIQSSVAPEAKVDVKVKPFGEGSFLIFLALHAPDIFNATAHLFSRENVSLVENILSIFSNTLNLKNFLKGKPPKETKQSDDGQQIIIENNEGNTFQIKTEVFNLYVNNPKIDGLYTKAFTAIEKEDNIEGFKIKDSNKKELSLIPKESFDEMAMPLENVAGDTRDVIKEGVYVQATRLSFEEGNVWGFVYDGNKVTAKITDDSFYKRIDANERFAKGDTFKVNLKVTQKFDPNFQAYLNKSFEITDVLEHTQAPVQGKLFEENK